jgi:hypothetical protein
VVNDKRVALDGAQPFARIVEERLGPGYAIPSRYADEILANPSRWRVLLIDKTEHNAVTGKLVKLVPTGERGGSILRYDVHMDELKPAEYKNISLSRTGIAILE